MYSSGVNVETFAPLIFFSTLSSDQSMLEKLGSNDRRKDKNFVTLLKAYKNCHVKKVSNSIPIFCGIVLR